MSISAYHSAKKPHVKFVVQNAILASLPPSHFHPFPLRLFAFQSLLKPRSLQGDKKEEGEEEAGGGGGDAKPEGAEEEEDKVDGEGGGGGGEGADGATDGEAALQYRN